MNDWLINLRSNSLANTLLFCFPYAGGSASIFHSWKKKLLDDSELIAIQPPGRGRRFSEQPLKHWEDLVGQMQEALQCSLDKDFILFGHSLGAKVAYELAQRLQRQGKPPLHLIVSGARAPHLPMKPPIYNLPDNEFIDEIRKNDGTPEEILSDPELMQLVLPRLRADYQIADTMPLDYGNFPVPCGITALTGNSDKLVSISEAEAWRIHTTGNFKIHVIEGGHFFIHSNESKFFQKIDEILMSVKN